MKVIFLSASAALVAALGALPAGAEACGQPEERTRPLMALEETIARALEYDLRPEAARAAVTEARAQQAIAALRPADTVSLEVENFPGTGLAAEIDSLEITGVFSRVWERGGKRAARGEVARRSVAIAEADIAASAVDVAYEVRTLYIELAVALEREALAREKLTVLNDALDLIDRRVQAARDPLLARARATADALSAQGELSRLERETDALRQALAAYWGGTGDFDGHLCALASKSTQLNHLDKVSASPELLRLEAQRRKADAEGRLAEADRVPDITWSAGVRKFGIDESVSVLGGISILLGAPKRSVPYEQSALAQVRRLEAQREAMHQALLRDVIRLERTARNAIDAVALLEAGPIPEAGRAVQLANDGYQRGAFSYLDVLDAQRALFALRDERLSHLQTYHLAEAMISRLTASDLPATFRDSN